MSISEKFEDAVREVKWLERKNDENEKLVRQFRKEHAELVNDICVFYEAQVRKYYSEGSCQWHEALDMATIDTVWRYGR